MVKPHKFGIKKKTMYDGLLVSDIWLRTMAYFFFLFAEGTGGGRNDCHFISLFIIDAFPLIFIYLFIF